MEFKRTVALGGQGVSGNNGRMTETRATVVAIDDERMSLKVLATTLEKRGYEVLTAGDGAAGLALLEARADEVQAVLLDRLMPGMDGLEVLAELRKHPELGRIPVIMQTSADSPQEIVEGINAGVYHYLTKPLDRDVLRSVVDAACADFRTQRALRDEVHQQKRLMSYIRDFSLELRTLEEARDLSAFVASFFPEPERVVLGLSELLINAVEHGNLGIDYDDKTALHLEGRWLDEVQRRLALPENGALKVRVRYWRGGDEATVEIRDEGPGFRWQEYMEISPERATHSHGRGIAMANMLSFDAVTYNEAGNRVRCTVNF